MKYAAILTSNADDIATWEKMSPEEAASARAQEVPQMGGALQRARPDRQARLWRGARSPEDGEDRACP